MYNKESILLNSLFVVAFCGLGYLLAAILNAYYERSVNLFLFALFGALIGGLVGSIVVLIKAKKNS